MYEGWQMFKKVSKETDTRDTNRYDGHPLYRRREQGQGQARKQGQANRTTKADIQIEVDNRWTVPYTPLLSKMFLAHINVEYYNSVNLSNTYVNMLTRVNDMAMFEVGNVNRISDEITQYQLGRYISSNETVWRILNFSIHVPYPTVVHLSVHLEIGRVYFTTENAQTRAAQPPNTSLTKFFVRFSEDLFAKTLFYADVPGYMHVRKSDALGRVYEVLPNNAECYYLRLLLHAVRGPTSFTDLKTINGVLCETYREAFQGLGLLENDQHWDITLSEASLTRFASQL